MLDLTGVSRISDGLSHLFIHCDGLRAVQVHQALEYGNKDDGVIEAAAILRDGRAVEIGYYFGTAKQRPIIKISAQAGCPVECRFCEVGDEPFGRNLTAVEVFEQVELMRRLAEMRGHDITLPHKISVAGTGEPLFNPDFPEALQRLSVFNTNFKLSTMLPRGPRAAFLFEEISRFAVQYSEPLQWQISLVSTDERARRELIGPLAASLIEIRRRADSWYEIHPAGRKINLSLIIAEETPVAVDAVKELFPPALFRFRFRPCVMTQTALRHKFTPITSERLGRIKDDFRGAGYEVHDHATPTPTEQQFGLASNVTRRILLERQPGDPLNRTA